jgi:hypothetical protein
VLSRYIGLVVGERTGRVYSVVSTETDAELDHPSHLGITVEAPETLEMVRWERNGRTDFSTFETIAAVLTDYYTRTHYRPDGPPYEGPDIQEFV